jgi:alpha-beta hydrolase superfamily lysophospholipase
VILIGTSTGGTLATWLAAQPSLAPQIDCLILLSPNFFPKNPLALAALWPPALRLFERLFGSWRSFTITNREHAAYWTSRYPVKALATMMQLVRLVWQIDLSHASMPVLMMVNPWDRVINVTLAILRFKRFPSREKNMIFFTGNRDLGRHVLAGDILSRDTTGRVLREIRHFLDSQTGS